MKCPQCQYENLPDAAFCENCGTNLKHICPQCQAENQPLSRFCRKCGRPLTRQSPALPSGVPDQLQDAQASETVQVVLPSTGQSIPESEPGQSLDVIYTRCCGLSVQRRKVVAYLCLYDADGQVHREVRTFGTRTWELLVLSEWLVDQGVTQVAIACTGVHWPRVHRVLEHTLTVQLSTDVKDVQVMVDLLAHGLLQGSSAPLQPLRALPHRYRRRLIASVIVLVATLLTGYWLWKPLGNMNAEQLSAKPPARGVRWQPPQVFYQQLGGIPFTLPLPNLERTPQGLPVDLTLEASGGELSWLQLDRERLHLRGTPPLTAYDQTYQLIVRAQAEQANDSRLLVRLTIKGEPDRKTQTPQLHGHWAW